MNELIVDAKIENTDAVVDFVGGQLEGCTQKVRNQIEIAVEEIFTNIARYAYHPSEGSATVRVVSGEGDKSPLHSDETPDLMPRTAREQGSLVITIEFEDGGTAFDPLAKGDPDVTAKKREAGGLGIFMVKNIMDSVEYRREGEKNILTIKKNGLVPKGQFS